MSDLHLTGEFTILEKHVFLKDDMGNDIALCLIEKEKFEPWHEGLVYLPQPVRFWAVLNLNFTDEYFRLMHECFLKGNDFLRTFSVNGFELIEVGYGGNAVAGTRITAFKVKPKED